MSVKYLQQMMSDLKDVGLHLNVDYEVHPNKKFGCRVFVNKHPTYRNVYIVIGYLERLRLANKIKRHSHLTLMPETIYVEL